MEKDKLILTEFFPVKGHAVLFANTIRILSIKYDIIALIPNGYRTDTDLHISNVKYINMQYGYYEENGRNFVEKRINYIKYGTTVISQIFRVVKTLHLKKVISLTYEEISFALYSKLMPQDINVTLMHHNNLDRYMSSSFRRYLFKSFMGRVNHIVQCGFMADILKSSYGLNRVIVWPHPLNLLRSENKKQRVDISCVGLSASNDTNIIKDLIKLEQEHSVFKENNLRVVFKCKGENYDDGYLKVFDDYISNEEFDNYIYRSKSIFIPFPNTFRYRMSGTLIDALTNGKYVIATNIPVIDACKKAYPHLIKVFDVTKFLHDLKTLDNQLQDEREFRGFRSFHSDANLSEIYNASLESLYKDTVPPYCNYDF